MGKNSRKHTLLQINYYLQFCIDTNQKYEILDKTAHFILKVSYPETVNCLMDLMELMDWNQEGSLLIAELKNKIVSFNPTKYSIDSHAIAAGALRLMQHGQILPKPNFDALLSVQILLNQMAQYGEIPDNTTLREEVIIEVIINPFLQFIGQLCKTGMNGSAQAIHNYLHLGYLIAKTLGNDMNEKDVGLILGPTLLDALEMDGCIYRNIRNDFWGSKSTIEEYNLIAQITHLLLMGEHFSKPFDATSYAHYNQLQVDRERETNKLYELLWSQLKPTISPTNSVRTNSAPSESLIINTSQLSLNQEPTVSPKYPKRKKDSLRNGMRHFKVKNKSVPSLPPKSKDHEGEDEGEGFIVYTPTHDRVKNHEKLNSDTHFPRNKLRESRKSISRVNDDDGQLNRNTPKKD